MNIRLATPKDAKAICHIYNYYVEETAITFETAAVSVIEMSRRITEVLDSKELFYVGEIRGYCYIHTWNGRCAYSSTKEVTIYLDKDYKGKGLGTTLYQHLFNTFDNENIHVLLAGICIPNESSVRLHEKFGFKQVSSLKEIGWKFNQWRDVGHWQLIVDKRKK